MLCGADATEYTQENSNKNLSDSTASLYTSVSNFAIHVRDTVVKVEPYTAKINIYGKSHDYYDFN